MSRPMAVRTRRSRSKQRSAPQVYPVTPVEIQFSALLAIAVIMGGGGSDMGLQNLLVQLAALAVLAANPGLVVSFLRSRPRAGVWLVAATIALPVLQCVPLPPQLWQAMPGRDLVYRSLSLIGAQDDWYPLSVSSYRTALAALGLVPPFALIVLGQQFDETMTMRQLRVLALLGLASVLLGLVQVATHGNLGVFYKGPDPAVLYGTFANRNSAALFLDICVVGVFRLADRGGNRAMQLAWWGAAVALALGVVLTRSRSGMAILVLMLAARLVLGLIAAIRKDRRNFARRVAAQRKFWAPAVLVFAALAGVALYTGGGQLAATFGRFAHWQDIRPEIWEDAVVSAKRFWPVGSGISTFDEVFAVDESLEYVNAFRAGRAHNDFIEVVLESGIAGIALALAWAAWIVLRVRGVRFGSGLAPAQVALFAAAAIMLQSIADYPLRNESLLCVAAFLFSILRNHTEKTR